MATTADRSASMQQLALNGGPAAVTEPLPSPGYGTAEIGEAERRAILDVLERKNVFRWDDADNSYVLRFEQQFAEATDSRFALAVSSGTAALVTGLTALGIGAGDEVIIPAYTYVATPAAIVQCGAVPVIAEIDETLTMDPADLERKITPHTRAIVPVHMRGIPSQMDQIMAIAERHGIPVLEDAAQADGGSYHGKRLGSIGTIGCFSLQASKTITSGEGGVVVTNDPALYARAAMAHDSGTAFWRKWSEEFDTRLGDIPPFAGNGYRMSELQGAMAFAQIGKLDEMLGTLHQRKREVTHATADAPGFTPMRVPDPEGECALSANFLMPTAEDARRVAEALAAEGVQVGTIYDQGFPDRHIYKYWDWVMDKTPISANRDPWRDPRYTGNVQYSRDMCPQSLDVLGRTVSITLNPRMNQRHTTQIAEAINKVAHALFG